METVVVESPTRLALEVGRRGGNLSDEYASKIVRMKPRRYKKFLLKARDEELTESERAREEEVRIVIPGLLSVAGLGGWGVGFAAEANGSPVVLISPNEDHIEVAV